MSPGTAPRGAQLGAVLFACLVVLTVAVFAVERAARSADDVVNTVVLSKSGNRDSEVSFTLAQADSDVDVLIIDGNEGSDGDVVATLAEDEDLAAGEHTYHWDGLGDDGWPVLPGLYALEVVLGEAGRDVKPPGRIEITIEKAP
jgi:hypothetical protein